MASKRNIQESIQLIDDTDSEEAKTRLLSLDTRANILSNYDFSISFRKILMSLPSDDWTSFVDGLKNVLSPSSDDSRAILNELIYYQLEKRYFSLAFIEEFQRFALGRIGKKDDVLVQYTSREITLEELIRWERAINALFSRMYPDEIKSEKRLLRIRQIEYPSSTLLIVAIVVTAIGVPVAFRQLFTQLLLTLNEQDEDLPLNTVLAQKPLSIEPVLLFDDVDDIEITGLTFVDSQQLALLGNRVPNSLSAEILGSEESGQVRQLYREKLQQPEDFIISKTGEDVVGVQR